MRRLQRRAVRSELALHSRAFFARQHKRHRFIFADPLSLVRKVSLVSDDAVLNFKLGRRRADVNELVRQLHELVEIERPVVERARQAKSVIDQHGLARTVAFVHPADLRNGGVRFIDHDQKIFREKIDDRVGLRTRRAPGQMPRVIFDSVAESHFLQHFEIVFGPHPQPLRFEQVCFAIPVRRCAASSSSRIVRKRAIQFVRRRDELFGRIKRNHAQRLVRVTGQRIEPRDRIDFVAEEFDADRLLRRRSPG